MTVPVAIVAACTTVFHLVTATIYGYHRDEFYYLAGGRRPAWGYVDHPPLTPLLYRLSDIVFGTSQFGLRIIPAVLHGASVIVVALLARELGGNGRTQLIAALATALAPVFVTTGHFLGTVTVELLMGATISLFVVKILAGGDLRWWLAVGAAVGIALFDKWTIAAFIAALGAALLLSAERGLVLNRWAVAGGVIALVAAAPTIWWQYQHDWQQLKFARAIRDYGESVMVLPAQFVVLGAASVLLAVPGLLWMLRNPEGRPFRPFAFAFLAVLVLVLATGGKPYYTAAAFPILLATGAVAQQGWTSWTLPAWLIGIGVLMLPFSTPLLPLSTADAVRAINPEIGEMVGWDAYVDQVAAVHAQYPDAPIFTANYSEAGAIELLAPDLPQPISGHVSYWYWGHPEGRSDVTIATRFSREYLERFWGSVEQAGTISMGVAGQEDGAPIWVLRDQREPWAAMWPALQRY